MKKLMIICFFLAGFVVRSQTTGDESAPSDYKYVIKFSPVEFLFSKFQMGFERNTGPNGSIQLNAAVSYVDNQDKYKEGYMGEFQLRSYVLGRKDDNHGALNNLYVGPFINYKHFLIIERNFNYDPMYGNNNYILGRDNFNAFGLGLITGLNTIVAKRFHIDFYVGGGIRISDSKYYDNNISEEGYKGIAPRFGIDVGVNF